MDIILVIGARKKIKWVIYLWIGLTYAQCVSICAYVFLFQMYWQAAVCLVYMAIISLFGIKMVQNIAVENNNEYSDMTNLTNDEETETFEEATDLPLTLVKTSMNNAIHQQSNDKIRMSAFGQFGP